MSNTPSPTPNKRRNTNMDHEMHVGESRIEKPEFDYVNKKGRKISKGQQIFTNKVLNVLKEPSATGIYKHYQWVVLSAINVNAWSGEDADTLSNKLRFFTPALFKNAEGILFNGKVASNNETVTTIGANGNFPTAQICRINHSSANFYFKNLSQQKMIVEMYICYGKAGGTDSFFNDWSTSLNGSGIVYRITGVSGFGGDPPTRAVGLGTTPDGLMPLMDQWDVRKILMKFEPGEENYVKMQGPTNFNMNASKKLQSSTFPELTPLFKDYNEQGCGCLVSFRTITSVTILTSTTGTTAASSNLAGNKFTLGHPVNRLNGTTATGLGGVLVRVEKIYGIEAPEGVTVPLRDARVTHLTYQNFSGSVFNNQLEEQQPATELALPK